MLAAILEIIAKLLELFMKLPEFRKDKAKESYAKKRQGYEMRVDKRRRTALDLLKLRDDAKKAGDKLP